MIAIEMREALCTFYAARDVRRIDLRFSLEGMM
jgi:hypothetical protein